jgi:hypothetical protein
MKAHVTLLLVTSVTVVAPNAFGGYGTNSFFVTLGERSSVVTPVAIEDAITNVECQPAENDPAGHWGDKIIGEQLSVRFAKDTYQTNEPIIAIIIYRNTRTDHDLNCSWAFGGDLDFQFVVKDKNGKELPDSFVPPERVSPVVSEWLPGTQYKYQSNLAKRYGLSKPETYSISVHRRLSIRDAKGNWEVLSSGTAKVKVVATYN